MFRGPRILTWSGPLRPLLLLREAPVAVSAEHTGAGPHCALAAKDKRYEVTRGCKERSLFPTDTSSCSTQLSLFSWDCDKQQLRESSSKAILSSHHHHHPSRVPAAAKAKRASYSWKCAGVEDVNQNLKALSIYRDPLINTTLLQSLRRTRGIHQTSLSLTNKIRSHLYHRLLFARPLSLSTRHTQILKHSHGKPQPASISSYQTRAAYQTHVAGACRDCLSPDNENRCRQRLGPNLKLYEVDKGRTWLNKGQGKNQAKWASVLVCLCSVEGEPSFLFTLRSSMLKGRHKGDVSFAGGKCDPSDKDVVDTALREAREELGVNVVTGRVWGVLKPLRDMSGMMIAPVLANLGPFEELSFKPNPGEVEEIFTLSLSHLCAPQNRGYTHFRIGDKYGYTLPVFRNGKHRVWGLTAVALDHTLKLIVPQ